MLCEGIRFKAVPEGTRKRLNGSKASEVFPTLPFFGGECCFTCPGLRGGGRIRPVEGARAESPGAQGKGRRGARRSIQERGSRDGWGRWRGVARAGSWKPGGGQGRGDGEVGLRERRGKGWGTARAGQAAGVEGRGAWGREGRDWVAITEIGCGGQGKGSGLGGVKEQGGEWEKPWKTSCAPCSLWRRVPPPCLLGEFLCQAECQCVKVCGSELPCWGPLGRRCLLAKAAEPQWVRRPDCMSAELATLKACVCRSKSSGGSSARWAPEGLIWKVASVCMCSSSLVSPSAPPPFPPPNSRFPASRAPGAHPLFWARGSAPHPLSSATKFICNKRERGASSQEGGSWSRSGSARGGRQAGWRAQSRETECWDLARTGLGRDAPGRTGRGGGRAWGSALRREGLRGMEPMQPVAAET